jgi:hypothetical protein
LLPRDAGQLVCGLVTEPMRFALRRSLANGAATMAEAAALLIGAGHGCDALLSDEPRDFAFSARLRANAAERRALSHAAARTWGVA